MRSLALLLFVSCASPSSPVAPVANPEPQKDPVSGVTTPNPESTEPGTGTQGTAAPTNPGNPAPQGTNPAAGLAGAIQTLGATVDQKPYPIALGNFTFEKTGVPGEFASFLSGELSTALSSSGAFTEYSRRDLDAIMTEQELSLSDLMDSSSRTRIGELQAVHGLLVGEYWSVGNQADVNLRLLDVQSGRVLGSTKVHLTLDHLPSRIQVAPNNLERTKQALESFQAGKGQRQFETKLWLDRGDGAVYSTGDRLQVRFQSEVDCYLRLYYLSANDELTMIFPNEYSNREKLKGGRVHVFPGEGAFDFLMSEPYGTELIYAVASTLPFTNAENSMTKLGGTQQISTVRTRGIQVKGKAGKLSESTCVYTVVR